MKNPVLLLVIITILAVTGFAVFTLSQQSLSPSDSLMKQDESVMKKDTEGGVVMEKNATSRYVEYSKAAFDQAAGKRRVLYFYASWCPTCRPTDANLRANEGKIPDDVVILRVNYNDPDTDQEEKDLAREYGITYQHTFVQVDATGKSVTKWNGGQIEELLANIT